MVAGHAIRSSRCRKSAADAGECRHDWGDGIDQMHGASVGSIE